MNDEKPIACSLTADGLRGRLVEIAAVGAAGLLARESQAGKHVLRFQLDPETRRRLEEIVSAEEECCPFLGFELRERDGELILTIAAPEDGQAVADQLARAFGGDSA